MNAHLDTNGNCMTDTISSFEEMIFYAYIGIVISMKY